MPNLPSSSSLQDVLLRSRKGDEIKAGALWADQPVVLMLLRRPGCVLCRYQAMELWHGVKATADELGVHVVCIVHEWIDREINAFAPQYWPGEIYHDVNKDLFKHLGGGKLLYANLFPLLNPFSNVWKRISTAKSKVSNHNLAGEGRILGGVLVINSSNSAKNKGKIMFIHIEKQLGLPAANTDIVAAVQAAVGKE